ncbi:alpha-1,2-fucosyltransferase [Candidatus Parcubacteria bacterium]|nr:alpha-1,2-fucosyltransferase [Candidatus Parcubacteria bacterium]
MEKGKNKIIVGIGGGLGNQLFQYALARNLTISKNKKVKFDLSWFDTYKDRRTYKLNYFNTIAEIATKKEVARLKKYERKSGHFSFFHNYFIADDSIFIKQKNAGSFEPKIFNIDKSVYLFGVWHSEKYFENIKDNIRKEITLKKELGEILKKTEEKMQNSKSVSLHIRRGDYITDQKAVKILGVLPLNYYHKAIKIISSKIQGPIFFIFSDDIDWVKENLKINFPTIFVSNNNTKDYEELILMSKCKHNIIANSSFSWWGAWLNQNPNKIVIAPKNWFRDKSINTKDLAPEKWIKL